ncbi:hypothetical protein KC726_01280 [Candidatus Woesebacteria bacterium]|nr:hypothetical protein [Candidatus Woesebacteria bacterium]
MSASPKKVLFIHHSTGANLIRQGHIRALLKEQAPDIAFWDHSYNLYPHFPRVLSYLTYHYGLKDDRGKRLFYDYDIVLSNNSPKEYQEIFSRDPADLTLSEILSYDLVATKNCFPTSGITSEKELEEKKMFYRLIRDDMRRYKDTQFIIFTPPPLRRETTTPASAHRAHKLATFMSAPTFVKHTPNVAAFDFFDLLSDSTGGNSHMLKRAYCPLLPIDSHPNGRANREIAPQFVKLLISLV